MPRMSGARAFAEMLKGYGTTHVFFVPTVLLNSLAEMERLGIQPVSAHGEKAAAYMADGYARATGRPGFCMAQTVGATNLAAGLKDAFMAGSPVIAVTGGPYPGSKARHVYQEIRDHASFAPVTKWNVQVDEVPRLPELLRQAIRMATVGGPGPVHLEARGHWSELVDDEAELDTTVEERFRQTPPFRPEPEPEAVRAAVAELNAARRPVIVAGGGVVRSGAEAALVELAEHLSIPVATSLNAKAAIPDDHPLAAGVVGTYARRCANEVVAAADLVLFVGSHTGSMVTNNWRIPAPGTTVLHLDIDPAELGRVYPTKVALMGDARAGLRRMIAESAPRSNPEWTAEVRAKVDAWWRQAAEQPPDRTPIRPERVCAELGAALPPDGTVVVDTLQASLWTGSFLRLTSPSQRFIRCAGSLGWGLPGAIGAKCALGERPVVCVTGDGGMYYHLAELETAARHQVALVVVVNNNGAYGGEARYWHDAFASRTGDDARELWTFGPVNFARIAEEMGCSGVRVERPEELAPAIREGLASGRPTVIDVATDPGAVADKGWG